MSTDGSLAHGVVLAHGSMAQGMVDAVRQITGVEENALIPLSNTGVGPEELTARVQEAMGSGPAVLFVDLQAGSCAFLARRLCRERTDQAALFGVNLPQLLDFVTHRELPVAELVPRLLERGRSSICCAPATLEEHADHSVSRG
ncbi:MAG TPA: hypothetical protein VMK65_04270 [Longimicrobiales bacterium]|nr:hypothetical protein [Longimicrobiales bacterium]